MREPPRGYRNSPPWLAFELWAETHTIGLDIDDWEPWWECFLAGFEVGLAEGE